MRVPIGLIAISSLYVLIAVYLVWIGFHGLVSILYLPFGLLILGVSTFLVLLAKALLTFKQWAWYGSVILGSLTAVSFLYALIMLPPQHDVRYTSVFRWSGVFIGCIIVLYLNWAPVRSRFRG
ncbi:MAG: hypothetical protein ACJ8AY_14845 [Gemmatimonadales bacterium]